MIAVENAEETAVSVLSPSFFSLTLFLYLCLEEHLSAMHRKKDKDGERKKKGKKKKTENISTASSLTSNSRSLRPRPPPPEKKNSKQTVRDKCFQKCVVKPSTALSSGEQTCLSRCCDRYSDATQLVLKSVLEQSGLS